MIVLLVIVIAFHYVLSTSYGPLYTALPLSIVPPHTSNLQTGETTHLAENGFNGSSSGSPDEKKGLMVNATGPHESINMQERPSHDADATVHGESQPQQDGEDPMKAFVPPAMKDEQRTLWLPNDRFGIGSSHVEAARKHGIDATNRDTTYNAKDKVETDAYVPPGELLL